MPVAVKTDCARLNPQARRTGYMINSAGNRPNRIDARLNDLSQVLRCMPAIDIATGEIHDGFGALQVLNPFADVFPVPLHFLDAVVFAFAE